MALAILIDDFEGDPAELYALVQEEVKRREIPGVKFEGAAEYRSKGWFSAGESAPSLKIVDETHSVMLLAYQFGRSFHVSTRAYWQKVKMAEKERQGKLWFLEEVRSGAFSETVDRAVREALVNHLEKRAAPVPPSLNPKEVFYRREAQTGEAEG
jgi:hypothetical protein